MKRFTRSKKLLLTVITSLIYQMVVMTCGFILPRLIITHYGSECNGTLSSISQFLSVLAILRLGVAGSLRVSFYNALSNKDSVNISAIVNSAQLYMHRIGWIIAIYVLLLIVFYPFLINNSQSYLNTSVLVFALGLGVFSEYFFGMTYGTLLIADQRLYVLNILYATTTLLNTIISVILIFAGESIQVVKLVSSILFFIFPFILNKYVSKCYNIDKTIPPSLKTFTHRKDAMGHSIANIIHENTDIVILTLFCGVKIVSVYAVYALVMTALNKFLRVLTEGLEAIFGSMLVKKEYENIQKYMSCYEFIIACFSSVIFSATGLLLLPFISLYTKGVYDVQYYIPTYAFVITLAYFFFYLRNPYVTIVQAAGHYKETKKGAYAEAFINLTTSLLFVQFWGLIGVAIGTLLANIFRSIQYVIYVKRHLVCQSFWKFVMRLLWISFNIILTIFICYNYVSQKAIYSWYDWCMCGVFIILIGLLCVIINSFFFYQKDLVCICGILSNLLKRKKEKIYEKKYNNY